jgi:methionyl-tRNA formyltransferase
VALDMVTREVPGIPQDDALASSAGFIEPAFSLIDWTRPAREIHNQVRMFAFMGRDHKVIEAAAKPLLAKIEDALSGLDWSKSGAEVDEPGGFSIDPEAVALQIAALRQQAVTIGQHGTTFAAKIRALDF